MALAKNHAKLFWLSCGVALVTGCSAPDSTEENGSLESPISGGTTDAVNTNVFGLLAHADDGVGACSSTLIAPNLLLTARHCIAHTTDEQVICGKATFSEPYPASAVIASNALDLNRTKDWYHASEIFVPSDGNDTCGYDVALIVLRETVAASVATPAVPRIDREVARGESYHAVGYGLTETMDYGVRRMLTEREVQCDPGTCRSGVRGNEFVGTAGPCQGDSGGPAFDTDGKVVGVDSRGTEGCEEPVYSTVTGWKDFIITTALHAAEVGAYKPASWVTTGSSDPPVQPPPPPPPPVALGDTCDAASVCADGGACYQPGTGGAARCVAVCKESSECRQGDECVPLSGQVAVCLEAPPSEASSGCQMGRTPSSALAVAVGGLALAFVSRRRRVRAQPADNKSR
ncbi:MAG TPA: S1 family peptidase [Polyangiaceae bacterium]|nr:S1 family peptidase [Polyangiaceae bacterium]